MLTKKNIFLISFSYVAILVIFAFWNGCYDQLWCRNYINPILTFFWPLLVIFPFSLITYKMKEEVFVRWWKFTRWWIPLTMFLTLITPDSNSVIMSWGKEVPAVGMTILYVFISTIIIIRTWLRVRKEQ